MDPGLLQRFIRGDCSPAETQQVRQFFATPEGQRVLAGLAPLIARTALDCTGAGEERLWSFTPGADIAAMAQAGMETRIFRS